MAYDRDDSDKTAVVLKDLWMFTNTTPESVIVRNLCKELDEKERDIFLTTLSDNWVYADDQVDQTDTTIMCGFPKIGSPLTLQDYSLNMCQSTMEGSERNQLYGHTPGTLCIENKMCWSLSSCHHRRTVFQEFCQPLHSLTDLGQVYFALVQATRGQLAALLSLIIK
jgi:hypothetical protein